VPVIAIGARSFAFTHGLWAFAAKTPFEKDAIQVLSS